MDYDKRCAEMMLHLGNNFNKKNFGKLIQALGSAIAKTMTLVPDHDNMHESLTALFEAIEIDACQAHQAMYEIQTPHQQPMDAETFLRDVFKPEKPND